jgi:hypothetical protein
MAGMKVLLVALVFVWLGLGIWVIRLSLRIRAEYRPPFGIAGPFEFLRLDFYSDKGRAMIAKAFCALALASFVMVLASLLMVRLPQPVEVVRPGTRTFPPDFFFHATAAFFFAASSLATLVLLLAAPVQVAWGMLSPKAKALRTNGLRCALYGAGALVVTIAHAVLQKVGPGLVW